jgi:hypothetical protein
MNPHPKTRSYLPPALMFLICFATLPSLAEAAPVVEVIPSKPGVPELIGRILEDPHRDYQRVHGPDDCNSEESYNDTIEVLGKYVARPEQNKSVLKDYIFSGEAACNCTRAVVGKNIDILMKDLGMDISELPCL